MAANTRTREFVTDLDAVPRMLRGNRGHGPKIISACCPTRRLSLRITSAGGTRRQRIGKRRPRGREIFFGARRRAFFGRAECKLAYTNFRCVHGGWKRAKGAPSLPLSEFPFSHRNCHFLLWHLHPLCSPRSFSDKERRGGDICGTRARQERRKKSDVGVKGPRFGRAETNNRKQGPKGSWKDAKRARKDLVCLSYNAYTFSSAYYYISLLYFQTKSNGFLPGIRT